MTGFVDTAQQTRRRRRTRRWLIALGVVIVLLVGADFAARAVAEQVAATQFQKQGNLSVKPDVTIEGFPFLTQVAAKDLSDVKVGITNLPEGPVTFSSINATATGIKLNSYAFNSGSIAHINGTAVISFASLGNTLSSEFGPLGQLLNGAGLKLSAGQPERGQGQPRPDRHDWLGDLADHPGQRQPDQRPAGREQRPALVAARRHSEQDLLDPGAPARPHAGQPVGDACWHHRHHQRQ